MKTLRERNEERKSELADKINNNATELNQTIVEEKKKLEDTIQDLHDKNDYVTAMLHAQDEKAQYESAHHGMEIYNSRLKSVDISGKRALKKQVDDLVSQCKLLEGFEDLAKNSPSEGLIKSLGIEDQRKEKKAELKKKRKEYNSYGTRSDIPTIELIVNKPNGQLDVIIPVKHTDLTSDKKTLLDKLFIYVEDIMANYNYDDLDFEGYIGFSLEGISDPQEIKNNIRANLPSEFGGKAPKKAYAYVKVADNFSFKYGQPSQPESIDETVEPTTESVPTPKVTSPTKATGKSNGGYEGAKVPGSKPKEITDIDTMRQEMARMQLKYDGNVNGPLVRETYSKIELNGQPVSDGGLRAHIANANRAYVQENADPVEPKGTQYSVTDRTSLHQTLDILQDQYKGDLSGKIVRQHCPTLELNGVGLSVGSLASHLAQSKTRYKSRNE